MEVLSSTGEFGGDVNADGDRQAGERKDAQSAGPGDEPFDAGPDWNSWIHGDPPATEWRRESELLASSRPRDRPRVTRTKGRSRAAPRAEEVPLERPAPASQPGGLPSEPADPPRPLIGPRPTVTVPEVLGYVFLIAVVVALAATAAALLSNARTPVYGARAEIYHPLRLDRSTETGLGEGQLRTQALILAGRPDRRTRSRRLSDRVPLAAESPVRAG